MTTSSAVHPEAPLRDRILEAAQRLLDDGGADALTNRAIAAAAATQPPVIYRVFGDKQGLLDALAERVFADHLADKAALRLTDDPVADLRTGWDQHVAFGLAQPAVYVMVYGDVAEGQKAPAAVRAEQLLSEFVHRVALAGRLRVTEPRATQVMHAAGRGVTLTLLATPPESRDLAVSDLAREATIAAITTDAPAAPATALATQAVALRAAIGDADALTPAERALMAEWLDRLAAVGGKAGPAGR